MTRRFRLRDRGAEIKIDLHGGAPPDRDACEKSRREVDALLWRGLSARDPEVRRALEAIHHELRGIPAPAGDHWSYGPDFEHSLAADLRFAAYSGRLRVSRFEPTRVVPPVVLPVEEDVLGPEAEPDAWIEIELLDEDGKPVPNADYRIECDDGRVRTGTTNGFGKAREEGLQGGSCKVSFPQVHAPEWRKAG